MMRRGSTSSGSSIIKFRRPSLSSAGGVRLPFERPKPLASAVKSLGRKVQERNDGGQSSSPASGVSVSLTKRAIISPLPVGNSSAADSRSPPHTQDRSPYDASLLSPATTTRISTPSMSRPGEMSQRPQAAAVFGRGQIPLLENMDTCGLQKNRKFRNALFWFHTTPDESEVLFSANIDLVIQQPEKPTKKKRKSAPNAATFNTVQSVRNLAELQKVLLLTEYSVVIYDRKAKKIVHKFDIQNLSDISRSDRVDYFVIHFPINQDDDILINCPHRDAFLELLCQRYGYLHEHGNPLPVDTGNNFTVFRQKGHFDVVLNESRKRPGLQTPFHRIEWKMNEGVVAPILSITRFTASAARTRPLSMMTVDTSSLQPRKDSAGAGSTAAAGGDHMASPLDVPHSCPVMSTPLENERFSFGSNATSSTLSSVAPPPQERTRRSSSIKSTTSSSSITRSPFGGRFNLPPPQQPLASRLGRSSRKEHHRRSASVGSTASRSSVGSVFSNLSRQSSAMSVLSHMSGDDNPRDLRSPSSHSYSNMTFGPAAAARHLRQLSIGSAHGDDLVSVTPFTGSLRVPIPGIKKKRRGRSRHHLSDINFSDDILAPDVLEMPKSASPRAHSRTPSILPQRSRGASAQQPSSHRHRRRKSIRERTNELFGKKSLGDRLKSFVSKSNRSSPDPSKSPRGRKNLRSASLSTARGSLPRRAGRDRSGGVRTPKPRAARRFSLKSPGAGFKRSDSSSSLNSSQIPTSYVPTSMKSAFGGFPTASVSPGSTQPRRKSVHNVPQASLKRSLMRLPANSSTSRPRINSMAHPQSRPVYAADTPVSASATPEANRSRITSIASTELPSQICSTHVDGASPPAISVNTEFPSQAVPTPRPLNTHFPSYVQSMYAEPGTPSLGKANTGTPSRSSTMYADPATSPGYTYSPTAPFQGSTMPVESATPPVSKSNADISPQDAFTSPEAPPALSRASSTASSTHLPSQVLSMYAEPATPTPCRPVVGMPLQSMSMHAEPPTALTRAASTESYQCSIPSRIGHGPAFAPPTPPPSHYAPSRPESPGSKGDTSAPNSRGGTPRVQRLNSSPVPRSRTPVRTPRTCTNARLQRTPGSASRFSRMRPPKEVERFTFDEILQTRPPSISAPETFVSGRKSSNSQRAKHARNASHGGNPPQGSSQTVSSAQPSSPWKSAFSALTESPPSFQPEFDALAPPDNTAPSTRERSKHAKHKKHRSEIAPNNKLSPKRSGVTHLRLYSASSFPSRLNGSATGSSSAPHSPTNAAVPWKLFHRKPGYKEFVVESPQNSPHEVYYNPNDVNLHEHYPDSDLILSHVSDDTNAEYRNPVSRDGDVNTQSVQRGLPRLSLSVTSTKSAPQMSFSPRAASGRQPLKRPSLRLMSHEEFTVAQRDSVESKDSDSPAHAPLAGPRTSNSSVRLRLASLSEKRESRESSFTEESVSEKRESRESLFTEENTELLDADARARGLSAPARLEMNGHHGTDRECAGTTPTPVRLVKRANIQLDSTNPEPDRKELLPGQAAVIASVRSAVQSSEACIDSSDSNARNSLNFPTDTAAPSYASELDGEGRSKGSITNVAGGNSPVNLRTPDGNSPVPSNLSGSGNSPMNSYSPDGNSHVPSNLSGSGNSPMNSCSPDGNSHVPSNLSGSGNSSMNSSTAIDSSSSVSSSVGGAIDSASSNFDKARNVFLSVDELNQARTKAHASHRIRSSRANFRLRVRPRQHLSSSSVSWSQCLEQPQ